MARFKQSLSSQFAKPSVSPRKPPATLPHAAPVFTFSPRQLPALPATSIEPVRAFALRGDYRPHDSGSGSTSIDGSTSLHYYYEIEDRDSVSDSTFSDSVFSDDGYMVPVGLKTPNLGDCALPDIIRTRL